MSQSDDRSMIATSAPLSLEIPKSDCATTSDEERQLSPSVQGGLTPRPYNKRSCSLSGSGQADGRSSHWGFDVLAEDDSETEGDGLPSSKRIRSSPPPSKAAEDSFSPAATVVAKVFKWLVAYIATDRHKATRSMRFSRSWSSWDWSIKSPLLLRSGCSRHQWIPS